MKFFVCVRFRAVITFDYIEKFLVERNPQMYDNKKDAFNEMDFADTDDSDYNVYSIKNGELDSIMRCGRRD